MFSFGGTSSGSVTATTDVILFASGDFNQRISIAFDGTKLFDTEISVSIKRIPGHIGIQSVSTGNRPLRQTVTTYDQAMIDQQPELATNNDTSVFSPYKVGATKTNSSFTTELFAAGLVANILEIGSFYEVTVLGPTSTNFTINTADSMSPAVRTQLLSNEGTVKFVADRPVLYIRNEEPATTPVTYISIKKIPAEAIKTDHVLRSDGVNDYMLTDILPTPAITLAFRAFIPAKATSTQIILGAQSSNNRCYIGYDAIQGRVFGGIGEQASSIIRANAGIVGLCNGFLTADGETVRLYANGAIVYEDTQAGSPVTPMALAIGANNNAGTPQFYTEMDLHKAAVFHGAITPAEALALHNQWNAS